MPSITEAIGYQCEVSVPNGPAVSGFILDRWAQERQPHFDRFLASVKAEALREAADKWHEMKSGTSPIAYLYLVDEADRIEREAGVK